MKRTEKMLVKIGALARMYLFHPVFLFVEATTKFDEIIFLLEVLQAKLSSILLTREGFSSLYQYLSLRGTPSFLSHVLILTTGYTERSISSANL